MPLTIQSSQGTLTAYLSGEIDHHAATALREEIDSHLLTEGQVSLLIMDFGGVTFMDSSGIGLVMGRYRLMHQNDGALQIVNCPPHIYKVMRIAGLHRLAEIQQIAPKKQEESL